MLIYPTANTVLLHLPQSEKSARFSLIRRIVKPSSRFFHILLNAVAVKQTQSFNTTLLSSANFWQISWDLRLFGVHQPDFTTSIFRSIFECFFRGFWWHIFGLNLLIIVVFIVILSLLRSGGCHLSYVWILCFRLLIGLFSSFILWTWLFRGSFRSRRTFSQFRLSSNFAKQLIRRHLVQSVLLLKLGFILKHPLFELVQLESYLSIFFCIWNLGFLVARIVVLEALLLCGCSESSASFLPL